MVKAPAVVQPKWVTNVLTFKYAASVTNNPSRFDWYLMGSTNLKDWYIVIYPMTNDPITVISDKSREFYRTMRRN